MMRFIRRYLIAGLLVLLPLWVTYLFLSFIIDLLDKSVLLLPAAYRPAQFFGFDIPGFGVILSLIILLGTGVLATNFIGQWFVEIWEGILARIPLVRTIYAGVKQILETLLSPSGQSFRKVLLVEYPRKGMWSIAFQTGNGATPINEAANEDFVTIFIPTTPNPTSGFLMLVPKKEVIELSMSVDEGLKFVISLGVLQPKLKPNLNKEGENHA